MLYLVATPIGNLEDISLRALLILRSCDLILCEDTRHSLHLLRHHGIKCSLQSFHQFNETAKEDAIIEKLKRGEKIALISDAGTPTLCDPGQQLVKRCRKENIPLTALPGPCAAILALTLSGFNTKKFQFFSFLPKKPLELKKTLEELLEYDGTSICYETPHRLLKTLTIFSSLDPHRTLCIARELTKTFEELIFGSAHELLNHFKFSHPRGEFVLLIDGANPHKSVLSLSSQEDVACLQSHFGFSQKESIKILAQWKKVPKKEIYRAVHKDS